MHKRVLRIRDIRAYIARCEKAVQKRGYYGLIEWTHLKPMEHTRLQNVLWQACHGIITFVGNDKDMVPEHLNLAKSLLLSNSS